MKFNDSLDEFHEVAPDWFSGPLPVGNPFENARKDCYSAGFTMSLTKVGDTLYAAFNQGLWYLDLKTAVMCPPNYNDSPQCRLIEQQNECVEEWVYCCNVANPDSAQCARQTHLDSTFAKGNYCDYMMEKNMPAQVWDSLQTVSQILRKR